MREVFANLSSAEVNLRRTMLEDAGIPTFVRNEALSLLTNAFIGPFQPALCVVDDDQYDEAMTVLRALQEPQAGADWVCPGCQEVVPGSFDSCWKCETVRPGSNL